MEGDGGKFIKYSQKNERQRLLKGQKAKKNEEDDGPNSPHLEVLDF